MAGKKKSNWILNVVMIICAVVFVYAAIQMIQIMNNYAHNEKIQTELQDLFYQEVSKTEAAGSKIEAQSPATPHKTSGDKTEESSKEEIAERSEIPQYNFEPLLEINQDIRGWIIMPAAGINYPVVQSYDKEDYLHTNFYGD